MSANPLVAEEDHHTSIYSGIGVLESATHTVEAISSGNWIEAGIGAASTTLDTLDVVANPIGALASYGVGWLIDHVNALSEALDWLAGNPDAIAAHAQTWGNVSAAVSAVRQDYAHATAGDLTTWQGAGAQAYQARATAIGNQLDAAAIAADGLQVAVTMAGMVVSKVRDTIRQWISDLVGYLLSYAAELACTAGWAAPVVAEQAMSLIAKWAAKIAKLIIELIRTIQALMPLLRHLDEAFTAIKNTVATPGGSA